MSEFGFCNQDWALTGHYIDIKYSSWSYLSIDVSLIILYVGQVLLKADGDPMQTNRVLLMSFWVVSLPRCGSSWTMVVLMEGRYLLKVEDVVLKSSPCTDYRCWVGGHFSFIVLFVTLGLFTIPMEWVLSHTL